MGDKLRGLLRAVIVLAGLAVLLYPSVSEYLSERNTTQAIAAYETAVCAEDAAALELELEKARAYNALLCSAEELAEVGGSPISADSYGTLLNLSGNGVMGYLSIPCLGETIPIYHGTEEAVMQVGVGHLEGTSLPVGGESTHAALSGHRGLPSVNLFTNLDQMRLGDRFYIRVFSQTLCYRVDQIITVLPEEMDALRIVSGEDCVTLVTCTPYGINSHRLLVRGTREPYSPPADGSLPEMEEGGWLSVWSRMPMQYRHLMMGAAALLAIGLLRSLWRAIASSRRDRRR